MAIASSPIASTPVASLPLTGGTTAVGSGTGKATVTGNALVSAGSVSAHITAKANVIGIGDTGGIMKRVVIVPPDYRVLVVPPSS